MQLAHVLKTLHGHGLNVTAIDGGMLLVEPDEFITDDLAALIVANKPGILAHLQAVARTTPAATAPPCPGSIAERVAIMSVNGTVPLEAEAAALAEHGLLSWHALADAHVAAITAELDRLPPPSSRDGEKLLKVTRAFLGSHWHLDAIRHGWPQHELFGVHPVAPSVRVECWGLIPQLSIGPHLGAKLESLDDGGALVTYRSGTRVRLRRFNPGLDAAVPWWECRSVVAVGEAA